VVCHDRETPVKYRKCAIAFYESLLLTMNGIFSSTYMYWEGGYVYADKFVAQLLVP
jgi:hypothetical protein